MRDALDEVHVYMKRMRHIHMKRMRHIYMEYEGLPQEHLPLMRRASMVSLWKDKKTSWSWSTAVPLSTLLPADLVRQTHTFT